MEVIQRLDEGFPTFLHLLLLDRLHYQCLLFTFQLLLYFDLRLMLLLYQLLGLLLVLDSLFFQQHVLFLGLSNLLL